MSTEPNWDGGGAPSAFDRPRPLRSPAEDQFLTDFSRNYLTGRRWLCRFAHGCVALGVAIGTVAAGWDHITAAAERIVRVISHSH